MKKANQMLFLSAFLLTFMLTKTLNVMQYIKEIWMPIPSYEGVYEISNIGSVKSLPRKGTGKCYKLISKQLIKGYFNVNLCKNNKSKKLSIHRLVGLSFLIDTHFEGAVINHKNGIKTDNRVENLEWCTIKQNTQHAWNNSLCKSAKYWQGKNGSLNHKSKPVLQFDKNMTFIKEHVSATFAAEETKINRQHISQCCTGTRKHSGGFIWQHKEDFHKI